MTESPYANEFYTFKGYHCGHGTDFNDWSACSWDEGSHTGHVNDHTQPLTKSDGPMTPVIKSTSQRTGYK